MPKTKRASFRIFASVIVLMALCVPSLLFFGPWLSSYPVGFVGRQITLYQFANYKNNELSDLNKNKSHWESQNIGNYHLQIKVSANEYNYNPSEIQKSPSCTLQIEVQNKINASLSSNTCEQEGYVSAPYSIDFGFSIIHSLNTPPSVDDLFISIKGAFLEPWCGPNGCECDGYYTYSVDYDPGLSYPKSLRVIHVDPPLSPIFCTLIGTNILLPDYEISIFR